jgi:hypothetical protein
MSIAPRLCALRFPPSVNIAVVRWIVCLVLTVGLSTAADAGASEPSKIQAYLNADGSGGMVVNGPSPGGQIWSWQACAQNGSSCDPFASGQTISTAGARPNTVFLATGNDGSSARSPLWHGNVSAAGLPGVSGAVRANALVTPVAGSWTGGWDGDLDQMQLAACATPEGTNCTALTDPHYGGCAHEAAVIDVAFTGSYLRVADQRLGVNTVFALYAVSSPYGRPIWAPGPTTSVAVVGRIAPATGPRAAGCGPPPLLSATLSGRGVARVRCGLACTIVLRAHRPLYRVRLERTLAAPGSATVQLPMAAIRRLGRGRASFSVEVDGTLLATRTVKFG